MDRNFSADLDSMGLDATRSLVWFWFSLAFGQATGSWPSPRLQGWASGCGDASDNVGTPG